MASLIGTAMRLVVDGVRLREATEALRDEASGRHDLLARAEEHWHHKAAPNEMHYPRCQAAALLLREARAR